MASITPPSNPSKFLPLFSCVVFIAISVLIQQDIVTNSALWSYFDFSKTQYVCENSYSTEILSFDPPALYINDFVNQYEMNHLLALSADYNYTYPPTFGESITRTSSFIVFPKDFIKDPVVACITSRVEKMQYNLNISGIEPFQIVRYLPGEKHPMHVDWLTDEELKAHPLSCPRLVSMFVYLSSDKIDEGEDELVGGETYFPEFPAVREDADGTKFARAGNGATGLIVRPVPGNAMLWVNTKDKKGDDRTAHTGLEIVQGVKRGMNILSYVC